MAIRCWHIRTVFFLFVVTVLVPVAPEAFAIEAKKISEPSSLKQQRTVSNLKELKDAIRDLKPGHVILIEQGVYSSGFALRNIKGTMAAPIIIVGKDPKNPPMFLGRSEGAKLSNVAYIKLENLKFVGFSNNGINIDDGGSIGAPSHHVILNNITIKDTGQKGNHDAIKMSGVDNFVIKNCHIEGWGGSGIDLVGCHKGVIQACFFHGHQGYRTKNAVQIKGGSSEILVQESTFINAGERIVNIGGSTGKAYFRPQGVDYEAKDVIVAGNRFVGGEAHLAWVTSRDSHVHHNIFYLPHKWVGRILQETKAKPFKPSQGGLFEANLVVTDSQVKSFINVGRGTAPQTFTFLRNAWYRFGAQDEPRLPTREIDGIYDLDPHLAQPGTPKMKITSQNPKLNDIGPSGYLPWRLEKDFTDIKIPLIKKVTPPALSSFSVQRIIVYVIVAMTFLIVTIRFFRRKCQETV